MARRSKPKKLARRRPTSGLVVTLNLNVPRDPEAPAETLRQTEPAETLIQGIRRAQQAQWPNLYALMLRRARGTGDWSELREPPERLRLIYTAVHRLFLALAAVEPPVSRRELLEWIHAGRPGARGPRSATREAGFHRGIDPAKIILPAHDALIREDPKRTNCKTACGVLATHLDTTERTIRAQLRRARTK